MTETPDRPASTRRFALPVERWSLLLASVLLAAVVVTGIGESISAAGAPEIGVVDTWGRIDEATSQILTWEYALALLAAFVLARRRQSPVTSSSGTETTVLFAVAGGASLLAIGAVVGAIAVTRRIADKGSVGFDPPSYYSSTEEVGRSIVYFGMLVILTAIAIAALWHATERRGHADTEG